MFLAHTHLDVGTIPRFLDAISSASAWARRDDLTADSSHLLMALRK